MVEHICGSVAHTSKRAFVRRPVALELFNLRIGERTKDFKFPIFLGRLSTSFDYVRLYRYHSIFGNLSFIEIPQIRRLYQDVFSSQKSNWKLTVHSDKPGTYEGFEEVLRKE